VTPQTAIKVTQTHHGDLEEPATMGGVAAAVVFSQ
jgi:hypothetical protein